MPDTVADIMYQKLSAQYGDGSLSDLLRQFWIDKGFGEDPPVGNDLLDFFATDLGAVGNSIIDRRFDYWTNYSGSSGAVTTSKEAEILWNVLGLITKNFEAQWNIYQQISKSLEARWDIDVIANLVWEIDASNMGSPADGSQVSSWNDTTGNARHAVQATAANRPLVRATPTGFNSNPAVEFGASDFLQVPYNAALNPAALTMFWVVRLTGAAGTYRSLFTSRNDGELRGYILYANDIDRWDAWAGNGINYNPTGASTGVATLNDTCTLCYTADNTGINLYLDNVLVQSYAKAYAPQTADPLNIGRGEDLGTNFQFLGLVARGQLYSRILASAERGALHSMAASKYAIS